MSVSKWENALSHLTKLGRSAYLHFRGTNRAESQVKIHATSQNRRSLPSEGRREEEGTGGAKLLFPRFTLRAALTTSGVPNRAVLNRVSAASSDGTWHRPAEISYAEIRHASRISPGENREKSLKTERERERREGGREGAVEKRRSPR